MMYTHINIADMHKINAFYSIIDASGGGGKGTFSIPLSFSEKEK